MDRRRVPNPRSTDARLFWSSTKGPSHLTLSRRPSCCESSNRFAETARWLSWPVAEDDDANWEW